MRILIRILKICGSVAGVLIFLAALLIGYGQIRWNARVERRVPNLTARHDSSSIARGEFLFKSSLTCWTCHSNQRDANAPPSGGMAFDITKLNPPLGIFYSKNITPDVETGIGGWTDGEIVRAIREGLSKDGTVLFPIMPIETLQGLSDEDALALVAYLRSIPPARNHVPDRVPSWFAKTLMSLGIIGPKKEIAGTVAAPPRALTAEYGGYIVKNASLCSDCHTPRNLMNGDFYTDSLLAGSSFQFGETGTDVVFSYAPNITPDKETGIGTWTEEQFLLMLRTGTGPDGKVRSLHMPYAYYGLWDSLELQAVYAYIKTSKAFHRTTPPRELVPEAVSGTPLVKGKTHFNAVCVACHGENGRGAMPTRVILRDVAPSLTDAELAEFVAKGNHDLRMPGFGASLSHDDLKAVVTFIRSWQDSTRGEAAP